MPRGGKARLGKRELERRARFRLKERHLWPDQFRGGHRSMRVEWERIHKMVAQLPVDDLPEYAQQWVYMIERTTAEDVAFHLRRGDFPYFDGWAHRFHILDEAMRELGYKLPARTPFIYAGYVVAGLAATATQCFYEAGGPGEVGSAFAGDRASTVRSSERAAAPDEDAPPA